MFFSTFVCNNVFEDNFSEPMNAFLAGGAGCGALTPTWLPIHDLSEKEFRAYHLDPFSIFLTSR